MNTPVAILDNENFSVLFADANPMEVTVDDGKKITRFAVEDGSDRADSAVQQPVQIAVDFLLTADVREGYERMREAYAANRLVVVQTRTGNYPSMQIERIPNVQGYDSVRVSMSLIEVKFVRPQYGPLPPSAVRNGADSSTLSRGQQQTEDASGDSSTLFRIFN